MWHFCAGLIATTSSLFSMLFWMYIDEEIDLHVALDLLDAFFIHGTAVQV